MDRFRKRLRRASQKTGKLPDHQFQRLEVNDDAAWESLFCCLPDDRQLATLTFVPAHLVQRAGQDSFDASEMGDNGAHLLLVCGLRKPGAGEGEGGEANTTSSAPLKTMHESQGGSVTTLNDSTVGATSHLGDVWAYGLESRRWTRLSTGEPRFYDDATTSSKSSGSSAGSSSDSGEEVAVTKAAARKRPKKKTKATKKGGRRTTMLGKPQAVQKIDDAVLAAGDMDALRAAIFSIGDEEEQVQQLLLKAGQLVADQQQPSTTGSEFRRQQKRKALDPLFQVARGGHSTVLHTRTADGDVELIVFGGKSRFFHNDVWAFSLATLCWRRLAENCSDKTRLTAEYRPTPRWGHSATVGSLSGFSRPGGIATEGPGMTQSAVISVLPEDFEEEDDDDDDDDDDNANTADSTQSMRLVAATTPSHSASLMWVFGGLDGRLGMASRDLYCFHLDTFRWMRVEALDTKAKPPPRYQHSAVDWGDALCIFGGRDEDGTLFDDMWLFNYATMAWSSVESPARKSQKKPAPAPWPPARFGHVATFDASRGAMCIVGGCRAGGEAESDVWEYHVASGLWAVARREEVPVEEQSWPAPLSLFNACAASDPSGADMFLFSSYSQTDDDRAHRSELWSCWPRSAVSGTLNHIPVELGLIVFQHFVPDLSTEDTPNAERRSHHVARDTARFLVTCASVCRRWREILLHEQADAVIWTKVFRLAVSARLEGNLFPVPLDISGTRFEGVKQSTEPLMQRLCEFENACAERRRDLYLNSESPLFPIEELKEMISANRKSGRLKVAGMAMLKVVVVGSGAVGKTAAIHTFCHGAWSDFIYQGCFDNESSNMFVGDVVCSVSWWDTAGQEDYDRLRPLSYPQTDCFILMYDVTNPASFKELQDKFLAEVRGGYQGPHASAPYGACPEALVMVVGAKTDLRDNPDSNGVYTDCVDFEEVREWASSSAVGVSACVEVSAKEYDCEEEGNLNEAFMTAAALALLKSTGILPLNGPRRRKTKGGRTGCPVQ